MDETTLLSEQALIHELGLDGADLDRRKRLVQFRPEDSARVAGLRATVTSNLDALVEAFFRYLDEIGEARGLLEAPGLFARAKELKREHLEQMVSGSYDVNYLEQRVRLATIYARAGLEIAVFLGAFGDLLNNISRLAQKATPTEAFEDLSSLRKLTLLDIGVIVDVLLFNRQRVIRQQQEAIRELSTPVLQVRGGLLLLPLIGVIDSDRARLITENLLHAIRDHRAQVVVLELTGVAAVDTQVANYIMQTISAAALMGAKVIVTGFSGEVSQALTQLGLDLADLDTHGDLQAGLEQAEKLLGYRLTKTAPARLS